MSPSLPCAQASGRFGADPFPLPFLPVDNCRSKGCSSKRIRARHKGREDLALLANDTIGALNDLYDGRPREASGCQAEWSESWPAILAASKSLRRAGPTGGEALRSLFKCGDESYLKGSGPPVFLTTGDVGRIAEPSDTRRVTMREGCSAEFLRTFTPQEVLDPTRASGGGLNRKARVFGSHAAYTGFLRRGRNLELIGFMKARDVKAVNDMFFIEKVGKGTLRKIIDCRPSNDLMRRPGETTLAGPWHSTEVGTDSFRLGRGTSRLLLLE